MKMNFVVLWMLCLSVVLTGVYSVAVDRVSVNVTKGDSVTLPTGVKADREVDIRWYFNETLIAQINGDLSFICTDVQCNEGNERYRDRLKLDHQTGSLNITNTSTTDSGEYHLQIIRIGGDSDKIFIVTVHVVSASDQDQMKGTSEKERESGLSSAARAGIGVGVGVVLLIVIAAAAVGVIYYLKRHQTGQRTRTQRSDQENSVTYTSVNRADNGSEPAVTEPSRDGDVNTSETS
ncbi:uncharacterized protein LOC113082912 [Carassius auratus]|uniref:Uncharacterized protein LOC113082912 n=1 Tax=Carassius auratus TaxID=7957 RepID=A0A6P6NMI3_CARAU|nr:uncharacterized protein LOC113082912 [Carassius auratus]